MKQQNKIVFLVGPTAVGKSAAALLLAERIGAEIISCDSMQIYKEVNIASGKPSHEDRKGITHHLIDIVSLKDSYDVFRYFKDANAAIKEIHERRHVPIVVGGTGLYMKVLLDGIREGAGRDDKLREKLEDDAETHGPEFVHNLLKEKDPATADKLHVNDTKRIIRALELCLTKAKPISEMPIQDNGIWGKYDITIFGLNQERSELYQKIEQRVDWMVENGLIDEIKSIEDLDLSETARYLIGIKEILSFLNGQCDLDTAVSDMKQNTRHYAKRQLTWFRNEKRISWINLKKDMIIEDVVKVIMRRIS